MMQQSASSRKVDSPEHVASIALEIGRLLMEAGASARHVEDSVIQAATGLGADNVDIRVGYASLTATVCIGSNATTQVEKVGRLGVNQKLHHALSVAVARIANGGFTSETAEHELRHAIQGCTPHDPWVVAIAVGVACAAFGRLLEIDWLGVLPVFAASTLAQLIRRYLAVHKMNVILSTAVVAFLGSAVCGIAARLAGSHTVARDMVTTVLLLVPGVPAFNAQLDILEGRPTVGSARAVWVIAVLVFMSAGVWLALGVLGEGR